MSTNDKRPIPTLLLLLVVGACCIARATPPGPTTESGYLNAVERFLKSSVGFESPVAEEFALSGRILPVERWPFLERLSHYRFYSFPERPGTPLTYGILAVDQRLDVTLLDSPQAFNDVISAEGLTVSSPVGAREIAEAFLRVIHYSQFRNMGWDLGINVIRGPKDIPFPSGPEGTAQQGRLAERYAIHEPRFETVGNVQFQFTLFSWAPIGGGLFRHIVSMEGSKVAEYRVDLLEQWVGSYEAGH
jgi:hypothetical protein